MQLILLVFQYGYVTLGIGSARSSSGAWGAARMSAQTGQEAGHMRKTEQAHTPFSARAALTAALILGLLLVGVIWMRQNDLRAKNDALEAQLVAAKEVQAQLKEELAAPFDEEYVKRVARRKLGYCMPGEIIYFNDLDE